MYSFVFYLCDAKEIDAYIPIGCRTGQVTFRVGHGF